MPNQEKFVNTWVDRIDKGDKAKKQWEEDYEVARCKQYWKGKQLEEPYDEFNQRRVQINRVHPTVRASIPTIYFHSPFVRVDASPATADTPGQTPGRSIDDKAKLLQDTGNTFVRSRLTNFDEATHAAMKEAYWAVGAVRVMYDATPVENPAADSIPMKEDKDTPVPPEPKRFGDILGLSDVPSKIKGERFYVKRIPARQLICSADQSGIVEENPWVGYWSLMYLEDVKRSKLYKNTEDLEASGAKTREDGDSKVPVSGKIKMYFIWDLRSKHHYVFAEGHKKVLLDQKFKRLPLKYLRFDVDPDNFWPIPPIYHQLHPQDEFNDSREWLRMNRKGTVPRYTYDEDAIDPSEMRKLESGEMGTYIKRRANTHSVIEAVPQPNYSAVAAQTLQLAKEEFNELSMSAGEQRGVPQSKTATQAQIIDVRSQTQESYERGIVSKWLASIVEEMIMLAVDKMSVSQWILLNADRNANTFAIEAANIASMYQQITHVDLEEAVADMNWAVTIETESMSPVAEQQARDDWMQGLSLMGNPIMRDLMWASSAIRKKTLSLYGMKSARDQETYKEALDILKQHELEMAQAGVAPRATPGMASQPGAPPGLGSPAARATPVDVAAPSVGTSPHVGGLPLAPHNGSSV